MKTLMLPALGLLALGGAALAQNTQPPAGNNRQMPTAEERYKRLDANADGKVTLDEFQAMRGMRGGQGGTPPGSPPAGGANSQRATEMQAMRAERFKAVDTNKDGNISLDEYKAAPMGPEGGMRRGDGQRGPRQQ